MLVLSGRFHHCFLLKGLLSMTDSIVSSFISLLKDSGLKNVFSSFDNIPSASKAPGIVTVIGISSLSSSTPIYDASSVYCPFNAKISVTLAAPPYACADSLYNFFDSSVFPIIATSSLYNGISQLNIHQNQNLCRLVLECTFDCSGIFISKRS